jgi:hypothetical protein
VETDEGGGKGSRLDFAFELLDADAMFDLAAVLQRGAVKYTPNNWRKVRRRKHIRHVLVHLFAYMKGDEQEGDPEEHLRHAFCRAMMALAVPENGPYPYWSDGCPETKVPTTPDKPLQGRGNRIESDAMKDDMKAGPEPRFPRCFIWMALWWAVGMASLLGFALALAKV